jgi:hypothetical protein
METNEENMNNEKMKSCKVAKDLKKNIESNLWLSNEFPL